MTLRALTLHRPVGHVMSHGKNETGAFVGLPYKPIENRDRAMPNSLVGDYLALHSGKFWSQDLADFCRTLVPGMPGSADDHPNGIVAIVRVIGLVSPSPDGPLFQWWLKAPEASRRPDLRWYMGAYGCVIDDVVRMDPVVRDVTKACHQGLWRVPEVELAVVRAQWKAAKGAVRT